MKDNQRSYRDSQKKYKSNKDFKPNDRKSFNKPRDNKPKDSKPRVIKKEVLEVKKLGINGEGIGYLDRKIVFIKGALPEETVDVEITNQSRTFYEANLLNVTEKSKHRVMSRCRNSKECMGCTMLHMSYPYQLTCKKEAIREAIRKYTSYDLSKTVFKDVIGLKNPENFIQEVNLPIVRFSGKITFGIFQRESKFLTIMTDCFKYTPTIRACLKEIEEILTTTDSKIYSDKFKTGLRFIKVKEIEGKLQVVLITGKDGVKEEVLEAIAKLEYVQGVFGSVNTTRHQEFDEVGYSKIYGHTRLELNSNDQRYLISVKASLGENLTMTLKKVSEINKLLENSNKIISLNCGVGLVELHSDKEFISIDEKTYHIEDAKLNKKYLNKDDVTFVKGDIDEKAVLYGKKKDFDTFLIQNGRFGLSDDIKETLRLSKVKNVIISCDSYSTLSKDLADLEKYYTLDKIVALDTFAYTSYVTTIVKLTRK